MNIWNSEISIFSHSTLSQFQENVFESDNRRLTAIIPKTKITENQGSYSPENKIPWISMKELDFLRKANPSWAECRLNMRCVQSKEIPMVHLNPVVSIRKRKPGLRTKRAKHHSIEACVSWRPSKWVLTMRVPPTVGSYIVKKYSIYFPLLFFPCCINHQPVKVKYLPPLYLFLYVIFLAFILSHLI